VLADKRKIRNRARDVYRSRLGSRREGRYNKGQAFLRHRLHLQVNNQIVPEIFYEIKRSEFVIADLSGNRGGVYYEAGFAEGLNKPVIISCRSDYLKSLHFDVKQKSAVIWSDENDLYKRLIKRIEATIGRRSKV
jgi:nucleoside 2-deoxyribosyltransferase